MSEPLTPVSEGVRVIALQTPTLPPATHTNTYVLGARDVVVVEPASPSPQEQQRLFDALGRASLRVRAVFLTHHHVDHIGAVEAVVARTGAPVWAHAQTASRVPFAVDRMLTEGEEIEDDTGRCWSVLHTPGHAPGHLVLRDPEGVLVAGDMVAGVGTILIEPSEGHMASYLASLERMREGSRVLLPSHGPPLEHAPAVLEHYLRHRLAREAKVQAALARMGVGSLEMLVPEVYADAPRAVWPLATLSLEAHLVKLIEQGEVVREGAMFRWLG